MRKNKLLICALFMSLILTVLPGMESYAAGETGESAAASGLQDENSQRLETVTAMDEDGSIYEVGETDGTVDENDAGSTEDEAAQDAESEDAGEAKEALPENGIALFSARAASTVSMKVVNFNTKSNDTTDFTYSGGSGYTNGDYGADAAYLGKDGSGNIRFMLAGVTGTVKESEVQVLDYSSVADNVSYYKVSGGKLIHYISYNLNKSPSSSINNGPAPSYLSEGTKYYSYDGHYFYTDYKTMLSDYQNGSNGGSAVNAEPFYNHFQFLDMNSSTNYTGDELNSILGSKISSSSSKLLGTGTLFVKYQDKYSVNALLSLGIAVNESAWGTSSICMNKNNLFGLNAVDKSPGESANYFVTVEDCIREFMSNWMANGYLSSSDWRNHGELLGNKAEGINVSYASDPYWGEKAAAIAWELDAAGGDYDYLGRSSDSGDEGSDDVQDAPPADNIPSSGSEDASEAGDASDGGNTSEAGDASDTGNTSEAGDASDTGNTTDGGNTPDSGNTPDTGNTPDAGNTSDEDDTPGAGNTPDAGNTSDADDTTDAGNIPNGGNTSEAGNSSDGGNTLDEGDTPDAGNVLETGDTSNPGKTSGSVNTSGSVKPTVSEPVEQKTPASTEKPDSNSITAKELADLDQGIRVSGNVSGDAALNVTAVEPNTDQYDSYVSADPVKGKVILGVYDITLTGTLDGEAKLTFHVGSEYNGKNVVILHYSDDGSYETYRTTVENGQAVISVSGFSPYVIALDDGSTGSRAPQTGDTGNPGLWIAMMGLSAALGMIVLIRRRSLR